MKQLFTAKFYTNNRKQLRKTCVKTLPVVLTANGRLQRSADTGYPFQQDPNFWYLTGITEPDIILVIDAAGDYLILPKRSAYQDTFDGKVDVPAMTQKSGITEVYEHTEGWSKLAQSLRKAKQVATIVPPPQYIEVYGMYTNPARWVLRRSLLQENEKLVFTDIRGHLANLRMVKQPVEIEAITRAINITIKGFTQVTRPINLKNYMYEYEIEADLTHAFRRQGSDHAFEPIIASGERACVLHNTDSTGNISMDELLLFDIGAVYEGYAADISRTVGVGSPSTRQKEIHAAVREVQAYAFSLLKPGVVLLEYEKQVEQAMGKTLCRLGLINAIETESIRKYYPHATSHHLGLDVHDADDRKRPLEPGMVLTVEPGIYIPEERIGVRIEDDVHVTTGGIEILSSSLPSTLD